MIVDSSKKKRHYTSADKASLDIFCDNDNIGVIVNLSQEINTIMWDRINRRGDWKGAMDAYYDNCLLSILSEIAIDMTKREYPIDCMEELKIVRAKYNDKDKDNRAIRPHFFAHVAKKKGFYDAKKKNYLSQMAPMDYLQDVVDKNKKWGPQSTKITCTIGEIVNKIYLDDKPRTGYVDLVLSIVRELDLNTRKLYQVRNDIVADKRQKMELSNEYFKRCVECIKNMRLNTSTMRELLIEMDNPDNSGIRRKLWTIVFYSLNEEMSALFQHISSPVCTLEECKSTDECDVMVYGLPFKKKLIA